MRTILFITISFPPYGGIASIRIGCFVKYLEQMGYNCIIFCPYKKYGYYDETSVANLSTKAVYGYEEDKNTRLQGYFKRKFALDYILCGLFPYGAIKQSKRIISKLIEDNGVDLVFASYPQFENLYLANWVERTYRIPWIADFRDIIEEFNLEVLSKVCFRRETEIVSTASLIITVSEGLKGYLSTRHLQKICVIPNGFDPDDYGETSSIEFEKFTISYTGNITGKRNPYLLLVAIDELIEDKLIDRSLIQVNFYGSKESELNHYINSLRHRNIINCYSKLDRKTIINIQKSSHLLLLLANADWKVEGILTGKLYEYLAAKRPIIAIPKYRSIDDLLKKTGTGYSFNDKDRLKEYVCAKYLGWREDGYVEGHADGRGIMEFSRKAQAQKLALCIEDFLGKSMPRI